MSQFGTLLGVDAGPVAAAAAAANTYSATFVAASSQRASVVSSNSLKLSGDFTLECWVKMTSDTTSEYTFFGKYKSGSSFGSYELNYFDDAGTRYVRGIYTTSGNSAHALTTGAASTLSLNTWIHLAVTFNSANGAWVIYKNGTLIDSGTDSANSLEQNNQPLYIAFGANQGGDHYYDGLIDEVRIWNVVRSGTQISNNYNKQLVGNETGLVAYYQLNNSNSDATSNANNITGNSGTFTTDVPFV